MASKNSVLFCSDNVYTLADNFYTLLILLKLIKPTEINFSIISDFCDRQKPPHKSYWLNKEWLDGV